MTRDTFINQLKELLSDLPESERDEAIDYYNSYFDDAAIENDAEVLESMGTPEQAASNIKAGLNDDGSDGINSNVNSNAIEVYNPDTENANNNTTNSNTANDNAKNQGRVKKEYKNTTLPTWALILIIVGCIIFSPVIIGVVCTIAGLIVGAFFTLVGIVIAILAVVIAFIVAGVACIGYGLAIIAQIPYGGLVALGTAFILFAAALLLALAFGALCIVVIPKFCALVVSGFKKLTAGKGKRA